MIGGRRTSVFIANWNWNGPKRCPHTSIIHHIAHSLAQSHLQVILPTFWSMRRLQSLQKCIAAIKKSIIAAKKKVMRVTKMPKNEPNESWKVSPRSIVSARTLASCAWSAMRIIRSVASARDWDKKRKCTQPDGLQGTYLSMQHAAIYARCRSAYGQINIYIWTPDIFSVSFQRWTVCRWRYRWRASQNAAFGCSRKW